MNTTKVISLLTQHFSSNWVGEVVEYQNTRIEKDTLQAFLRFSVVFSPPKIISLNKDTRRRGSIFVQCFTKQRIGLGKALSMAEQVGVLFKDFSFESLRVDPVDIQIIGEKASQGLTTTEIEWFQINSIIDFDFID